MFNMHPAQDGQRDVLHLCSLAMSYESKEGSLFGINWKFWPQTHSRIQLYKLELVRKISAVPWLLFQWPGMVFYSSPMAIFITAIFDHRLCTHWIHYLNRPRPWQLSWPSHRNREKELTPQLQAIGIPEIHRENRQRSARSNEQSLWAKCEIRFQPLAKVSGAGIQAINSLIRGVLRAYSTVPIKDPTSSAMIALTYFDPSSGRSWLVKKTRRSGHWGYVPAFLVPTTN